MWKDFLYYTRAERRSVIVVVVLIVLVGSALWLIPDKEAPTYEQEDFNTQYEVFMSSLQQVESEKKSYQTGNRFPQKREVVLTSFDPNTTDSTSFLDLGLPSWMIKNILNYRNKGGRFRKAEDFAKIYGLKQEQYLALASYIAIDSTQFITKDTAQLLLVEARQDSFPKTIKFEEGTIVNINQADTTQLKMIPGIGSNIARMIINYRNQLGGYYNLSQLEDIRLKTELLQPWFEVNSDSIVQLVINKMGVEALRKHPYLNFYQAKTIVEHRDRKSVV